MMEWAWVLVLVVVGASVVVAAVAASSGRSFGVVLLLCLVLTPLLGAVCAVLLRPRERGGARVPVQRPAAPVDPVQAWAEQEEAAAEGRRRLPPL